jgi:hypothetical protein
MKESQKTNDPKRGLKRDNKSQALPIEIKIEIIHNNTGKLDRLMSIGPLYLAIQDLWVSLARVSSTKYTYRHT